MVHNIHAMLRERCWTLEIAKYCLMSVLHDNDEFPDFVLSDETKDIIENHILPYDEFKEDIGMIQSIFQNLIGQIDYEYIKERPYRPERDKDINAHKYTPLGTLLFMCHYLWSLVDTT
jgi:hypothetical protein